MGSRLFDASVVGKALDGLVSVDPMLAFTGVNETMCRMSGYSREKLIGTPFSRYFSDTKAALTNSELTLGSKDGRESVVSFNTAAFKGPDGQGALDSLR